LAAYSPTLLFRGGPEVLPEFFMPSQIHA